MQSLRFLKGQTGFVVQALCSIVLLYPFYLTFDEVFVSEAIRRTLGMDPMGFPAVFALNFAALLIVATLWAHVLLFRTIFRAYPLNAHTHHM